MPQKSSITRLPKEIREAIDAAIREDRATIREIVEMVRGMGAQISESAMGRHKKSVEESMEHYRQAQSLAKTWAEQIPENGDVAQLVRQMLTMLAFRAASNLNEGEDFAAQELAHLGRLTKDIASATKIDFEARAKIRAEALQQAAKEVDKVAVQAGLSDASAELIRKKILGVA